MQQISAIVYQDNGKKMARFHMAGMDFYLEILNPEGLRHKDLITVKYNGRDNFVVAV